MPRKPSEIDLHVHGWKPGEGEKHYYLWSERMFTAAKALRKGRKEKLVLVVEDDGTLRRVAQEVLRVHYTVMTEADGYEGMELYNAHAPDLLLLDITLPHISGLRILNDIMEYDREAAIVMFTGDHAEYTLLRTKAMGIKGFVAKPVTASVLLHHVRAALGEAS